MRFRTNVLRAVVATALLGLSLVLRGPLPAMAAIEPGPGKGWLMIASRTRAEDAIALASRYARRFGGVVVFQSTSGYYGVSLGWADIDAGQPLLRSLISSGDIPADSYFTAGGRFIRAIWSASDAHTRAVPGLISATGLFSTGDATASRSQPAPPGKRGHVAGLDGTGDDFLSLRAGPGGNYAEIARMLADTEVTIVGSSGNWYEVTLANGLRGWAYGKYIALGDIPTVGPSRGETASPPVPTVGPQPPAVAPQPQQTEVARTEKPEPAPPRQPVAIADQKRVALVLGNSAYRNTVELPNPRNDAAAMADKLAGLGFQVISALDSTKAEMEGKIRDFVKAMTDSDVALFFYAGHGMQVNGVNYLIPVDARLEDATALDFETIDLNTILAFMNRDDRISIALLDACRDNPMSRRFARSLGATRSAFIGRGLAAPSAAGGQILIGFATSPGDVALDGTGANSPFTTALLNNIGTKGLEIELMLKRVKQEVYDSTNKEQEPWNNSALRREFYFNPD